MLQKRTAQTSVQNFNCTAIFHVASRLKQTYISRVTPKLRRAVVEDGAGAGAEARVSYSNGSKSTDDVWFGLSAVTS